MNTSLYRDKIKEAFQICKNFDEKDTPFVALALKLDLPIWTNDKGMIEYAKKSKRFETITTEKLIIL